MAAAVAALLIGGCELLGAAGAPTIFVVSPDNFSIMAESPTEASGIAFGQIDQIGLTVDGEPAGRPQAGDSLADWLLPFSRSLEEGVHRVRAVASGPDGTSADTSIFAIGSMPFTVGFAPERLVVDRSVRRDEPVPVHLGILGPPGGDEYQVRLALEDAGGLIFDVFPFNALESTAGFYRGVTDPIATGQWVFIDLTVDGRTPLGEHQLRVRADGPTGTEPQRATLTVEVIDGTAPPSQDATGPVAPGAPHVETYRVRSRVTELETPGGGDLANANWRLAFPCADGRCDVEVRNGGPRGGLDPFTAHYDAVAEAYRFETTQQIVGESCTEVRSTGQIEPETWDGRGPVRFRYRLEGVNRCGRSDIRIVWEGTGRRR